MLIKLNWVQVLVTSQALVHPTDEAINYSGWGGGGGAWEDPHGDCQKEGYWEVKLAP